MTAQAPGLWRAWTVACATGETLGIGAAAAAAVTALAVVDEPDSTAEVALTALVMTAGGIIEGLAISIFQWRVLRAALPALRFRPWAVATTGVAAGLWLLSGVTAGMASAGAGEEEDPSRVAQVALGLLLGLFAGAVFGAAQRVVLASELAGTGQWVLANALGWAGAMGIIFAAASIPSADTPVMVNVTLGLAAGALAGLTVGAVTGVFLVRIVRTTAP